MKYRIIILIIIIKRLGEILLSYMANTSHTHARTHPVSMYFPSQHFMILLVDDVVSSRRPITPEIHLLSLTIFTQEALVTLICMNLSVSYPNWYELKWYACANYLWVKNRICGQRCSQNGSCLPSSLGRSRHLAWRYKLPLKLLRRSDVRWRWTMRRRQSVIFRFLSV